MSGNINNKISDYILERYILGELSESKMAELAGFISDDPDLRRKIASLKKSNVDILEEYPSETVASMIKNSAGVSETGKAGKAKVKYFAIPSLAAAVAAAVFFISPLADDLFKDDAGRDITRIKGAEANIYLYRKINGNVEQLADGSSARKNDLLQIAYSAAGKQLFGTIISIDGRGTVTLHYPVNGSSSKIRTGSKVVLENSYELDDAPSFEKFFFFISVTELNPDKIISGAKILASDPDKILKGKIIDTGVFDVKPSELKETSLTIIKKK